HHSMSRAFRLTLVSVGAFAFIAGVAIAWAYWQPALRYRESMALAAARSTVARYLARKDSLDVAAHRLAYHLQRWEDLMEQRAMVALGSSGTLRIQALDLAPTGTPPDDPRVQELVLNALRLKVPERASAAFKTEHTQVFDSIIRAHGYRLVP
ncbi:MAG: hypothetical protein ACREV1_17345, partial [Gammaproteobacteria bacterium]